MYPVENGIYHVRRSGMSVAMEYLRISEQECAELYKASEDELYFKYQLFNLGIVDRWKRESEELIAELENCVERSGLIHISRKKKDLF